MRAVRGVLFVMIAIAVLACGSPAATEAPYTDTSVPAVSAPSTPALGTTEVPSASSGSGLEMFFAGLDRKPAAADGFDALTVRVGITNPTNSPLPLQDPLADSNGTAQLNLADGSVVQGKFGVGDGYGGITSLHEVISSALLIEDRGFKFLVPAHVTICGLGNGGSSQSDESPLGGYFTVPSGTKPASLIIPSGPTLDLNGSPAQCSEPSPVPGGMTLPAKVTMPGTGASGQIVAQVEMAPYDGMDTSQEPKLTVVNMSAKTVGFNAIYLLTLFQDGMLAMQRPQDCADTVSSGASASCQYLYTHLVPGSHLILEAPDYGVAAIIG